MTVVLSISTQYGAHVLVSYELSDGDAVVDPVESGVAVSMAFPSVGADPAAGDWKAAEWLYADDQWHAQCMVGPGGAVELAAGTYDVWLRASGGTVGTPVERARGRVRVF